jgi:hypothetical protein
MRSYWTPWMNLLSDRRPAKTRFAAWNRSRASTYCTAPPNSRALSAAWLILNRSFSALFASRRFLLVNRCECPFICYNEFKAYHRSEQNEHH